MRDPCSLKAWLPMFSLLSLAITRAITQHAEHFLASRVLGRFLGRPATPVASVADG